MAYVLIILYIVYGIILFVVHKFTDDIVKFDSFLFSLISGILCYKLLHIHPALSLIIGIVLFFLLMLIQSTKIGFLIMGGIFSLLWSLVFGIIAYMFSSSDMIWFYVIWGLGFAYMIYLHYWSRSAPV